MGGGGGASGWGVCSIRITQEIVRNAHSQALPTLTESETSKSRVLSFVFQQALQVILMYAQVQEPLL